MSVGWVKKWLTFENGSHSRMAATLSAHSGWGLQLMQMRKMIARLVTIIGCLQSNGQKGRRKTDKRRIKAKRRGGRRGQDISVTAEIFHEQLPGIPTFVLRVGSPSCWRTAPERERNLISNTGEVRARPGVDSGPLCHSTWIHAYLSSSLHLLWSVLAVMCWEGGTPLVVLRGGWMSTTSLLN